MKTRGTILLLNEVGTHKQRIGSQAGANTGRTAKLGKERTSRNSESREAGSRAEGLQSPRGSILNAMTGPGDSRSEQITSL